MKQKLCLSAIHQIAISLQRTHNLNPRTKWSPALDDSNRMKSAHFTIHLGKNPPPQNGCRSKSVLFFKFLYLNFVSTSFTSSTFPIQPDFSQNQLVAITLNTSSPGTLIHTRAKSRDYEILRAQKKVSKGHPKSPPESRSVVTDLGV